MSVEKHMIMKNLSVLGGWVGWGGTGILEAHGPYSDTRRIYRRISKCALRHSRAHHGKPGCHPREAFEVENIDFPKDALDESNDFLLKFIKTIDFLLKSMISY
jgi:hypothetical protein